MPDSRNSKLPRNSKPRKRQAVAAASGGLTAVFQTAGAALLLAAISAAAAWFFYSHGYLLYYGDAMAHLAIARRIVDARAFTVKLIGTVWLPLPHLLMLPFVQHDPWWRNGLAGTIPMTVCFVTAGTFLFAAVRRALGSGLAALVAVLVFALNPNLLYLQSTAMTEALFFACVCGALYFSVAYRQTPSPWLVAGAAVCVLLATLTRYEGWFLIPFFAIYFLLTAPARRFMIAAAFALASSLGALWWLGHNWWFWGDPLEFYRGPYSAIAIYNRQLAQGMQRYAGDHDWGKAWLYYRAAATLCVGTPLFWMGAAGLLAALWKRAFWPVFLLTLPPVFYVMSLYSSGTPIFVPQLWPNAWYNTRYGLAVLPLFALGAGAIVAVTPARLRGFSAAAVLLLAVAPWFGYPRAENWICWKESQVNSAARRELTHQAAAYLRQNYRTGDGVFFSFGDLTAVLQEADIPLRESLHDGTEPLWLAALARPDLFAHEKWAIAISGDRVSDAIQKARPPSRFERVQTLTVYGAAPFEIYRKR